MTRTKQEHLGSGERVILPTDVRPERYDIHVRPNPETLSFSGRADIALTVLRPTDRIVLNAADLAFGKVTLSGTMAAPKVILDDAQQTAAIVFDQPLKPGRATLSIDYTGKIYQQPSGMFALDYATADGTRKRALFTQFEAADARRFAPVWDEPGIKAIFSLSVDAPVGQMAVSNMPVARTGKPAGGLRRITFQDSPRMSGYLLFLALGDFERIYRNVDGVDVGVVVRCGETAKGRFALDAAASLLPYYNDWFAKPYPLPKLDLVAGPGASQFFGAMENWGAIFFFDPVLLLDPKLSTESDRQSVFSTVAHEVAHQWFGDLVTMAWWDDLWLNESFASWMASKATDHFNPRWNTSLQDQNGRQAAIRLDSLTGTHPVITDIPDVFAAANAFDLITYQKGQAVVSMLEAYVGEEAFRAGVRRYIAANAYGNAVNADLWAALDAEAPGRKVSEVAQDFLKQPGVPLISAAPAPGGLILTQGRFAGDESQTSPQTWRTPVTVRGADGEVWSGLVSADSPASVKLRLPAVINAGQFGYLRARYAPELWAGLAPRFGELPPADQLGLLYDSRALGEVGLVPMSDYLELARNAPSGVDAEVAQTLARQLGGLDYLYEGRATQPAYRAFAISRLGPIARRLGWDPRPGDPENSANARSAVLSSLGEMGDPEVVQEGRRRFEGWLVNPDSLSGDERLTVLSIVAANADARTWEALQAKAKASRDSTDRGRLYAYLGASRDPGLADRALALALTDQVTPSEAPEIVRAVSDNFPDRAFDFALANRARFDELIEPASRSSYYVQLAQRSRDRAMLAKLSAFAATLPASARGEVDKAIGAIQYRISVLEKRMPEMDLWVARSGAAGTPSPAKPSTATTPAP
ncbi:MAG: M1 family metallopeptidase [Phenylobacterium sp.]